MNMNTTNDDDNKNNMRNLITKFTFPFKFQTFTHSLSLTEARRAINSISIIINYRKGRAFINH